MHGFILLAEHLLNLKFQYCGNWKQHYIYANYTSLLYMYLLNDLAVFSG